MNRHNKDVFLAFVSLSIVLLLLCTLVLTITGVIDISYIESHPLHPTVERIGSLILFLINVYLISKILIGKKCLLLTILYIPLYLLSRYVNILFISSTFALLVYLFIANIFIKSVKNREFIFSAIIFTIICGIFQICMLRIKSGVWNDIGIRNTTLAFLYSIDLYIFYILYYKVVKKYVLVAVISILSVRKRTEKPGEQSKQTQVIADEIKEVLEQSRTPRLSRALYLSSSFIYQVVSLLCVLFIGKINNQLIEIPIMLFVFFSGRLVLGKSWHSDSLWLCFLVTNVTFYILTKVSLPIYQSLFSSIVCSASMTYGMYVLADVKEWKEFFSRHMSFDPNTCEKELLIERCRLCGFSAEQTTLCIEMFYDKLPAKELAQKYFIEEQSMRDKKKRMKSRLVNFENRR